MAVKQRCFWCGDSPDYVAYHDDEWGYPVTDERRLFEKISLEGFQSGLSWLTILRKREGFRSAFANFEIDKVARFTQRDVERMLNDASIVRHRGKIESVINNAKRAQELRDEFGTLSDYVWGYQPDVSTRPGIFTRESLSGITKTAESIAMSKDLRKRGWTYVGPTTLYAFMQAMGLVNDHLDDCYVRAKVEKARKSLKLPRA